MGSEKQHKRDLEELTRNCLETVKSPMYKIHCLSLVLLTAELK